VALYDALSDIAGDRRLTLDVEVLNPSLCAVETALPSATSGGFRVDLGFGDRADPNPAGRYFVGENPVIDIVIPADVTDGYLWVAIVDVAGKVYHLIPNLNREDASVAALRDGPTERSRCALPTAWPMPRAPTGWHFWWTTPRWARTRSWCCTPPADFRRHPPHRGKRRKLRRGAGRTGWQRRLSPHHRRQPHPDHRPTVKAATGTGLTQAARGGSRAYADTLAPTRRGRQPRDNWSRTCAATRASTRASWHRNARWTCRSPACATRSGMIRAPAAQPAGAARIGLGVGARLMAMNGDRLA
jgi:hypothetical protein